MYDVSSTQLTFVLYVTSLIATLQEVVGQEQCKQVNVNISSFNYHDFENSTLALKQNF